MSASATTGSGDDRLPLDRHGLPVGPASDPFLSWLLESVERQVAGLGWDQAPRLLTLTNPTDLSLAAGMSDGDRQLMSLDAELDATWDALLAESAVPPRLGNRMPAEDWPCLRVRPFYHLHGPDPVAALWGLQLPAAFGAAIFVFESWMNAVRLGSDEPETVRTDARSLVLVTRSGVAASIRRIRGADGQDVVDRVGPVGLLPLTLARAVGAPEGKALGSVGQRLGRQLVANVSTLLDRRISADSPARPDARLRTNPHYARHLRYRATHFAYRVAAGFAQECCNQLPGCDAVFPRRLRRPLEQLIAGDNLSLAKTERVLRAAGEAAGAASWKELADSQWGRGFLSGAVPEPLSWASEEMIAELAIGVGMPTQTQLLSAMAGRVGNRQPKVCGSCWGCVAGMSPVWRYCPVSEAVGGGGPEVGRELYELAATIEGRRRARQTLEKLAVALRPSGTATFFRPGCRFCRSTALEQQS